MGKYRKKPIVIEAMRTDGTTKTADAIREWSSGTLRDHWVGTSETSAGKPYGDVAFHTPTLEGSMLAAPGDWIIRGPDGEYYPCKPDIFKQTYEEVNDG